MVQAANMMIKVDSFLVETRVHKCFNKDCQHLNWGDLQCHLKTVTIDAYGKCAYYEQWENKPIIQTSRKEGES